MRLSNLVLCLLFGYSLVITILFLHSRENEIRARSDTQRLIEVRTRLENSPIVGEAVHPIAGGPPSIAVAAPSTHAAVLESDDLQLATALDIASDYISLLNNPEGMQALERLAQGRVKRKYAELFRNLNLPPEKLGRLQELLLERSNTATDSAMAMLGQGINPFADPEKWKTLQNASMTEAEQGIQQLLGERDFEKYRQFLQSAPARQATEELRQSLSFTDSPLTDAQAAQLTARITQAGGKLDDLSGPSSADPFAGVLQPRQLDAFRALQSEYAARSRFNMLMNRNRAAGLNTEKTSSTR